MKYTSLKSHGLLERTVRNGIFFDKDIKVVAYSEEISDLFGFSQAEYLKAVKENPLTGIFELDQEAVRLILTNILEQNSSEDFYFRADRLGTAGRWLHAYGDVICTDENALLISVEVYRIEDEARCLYNFLDNDPDILYVCEEDTWQMLFANKSAIEHWGHQDYIGRTCYEFIKGRSAPCVECPRWQIQNGHAGIEAHYDEYLKCWIKGDCHTAEWYGRSAFYHRLRDISETHEVQNKLDMKELLLRRISRTIYEFIGLIDVTEKKIRFVDVNNDVRTDYNSSSNYYEGCEESIRRFVVPEEREYCRRCCSLENIVMQLSINDTYSYTWSQPTRSGSDARKQITFCWLDDSHKDIVILKSDVTDAYRHEAEQMRELFEAIRAADAAKRAEQEMTYRAENDSMTGTLNRESIRKYVDALLAHAEKGPFAFLMIDLDNFKQVNDNYGHSEGDRVITEAAEVFRRHSEKPSLVGRLGGDEFCVFYPSVPSKLKLCLMAEKICRSINEIAVGKENKSCISCSIGIAYCKGKTTFENIYSAADEALYKRKKEDGKNGYTFCEI